MLLAEVSLSLILVAVGFSVISSLFSLLLLSLLNLFSGIFSELLSEIRSFILSSVDFIQRHTNNGSVDTSSFLGSSSLLLITLAALLVESSPRGCPGKFDSLGLVVEELLDLTGDEEVSLAISSDELLSVTRVHFDLTP